jgi:ABC-type lipoprotein release transport system permease subunit
MTEQLPVSFPLLSVLAGALILVVFLAFAGQVPLGYNLRNLAVRWFLTLMTASAFTMVVALLIVMLAFVNGMYKLTKGSGQPGNIMILSDGATDELFSNLAYGDATDVLNKIDPHLRPALERDDQGKALLSKEVYVVANQPVPGAPKDRPRRRFIQLRGLEDALMASRVHHMDLLEGAWFSEAGVQDWQGQGAGNDRAKETAIQVVIGESLSRELARDQGKERLTVGDTFELGPNQEAEDTRARKWVVVGVLRSAGSTFASEIWAKHGVVGKMFGKEGFTSLVLRSRDAESAQTVAADIRANAKLKALPETEYFANLSETNKTFLYAIVFVAIVMAVGGVFGVMNTMFAAISQRTKDIGVLRILGFRRWQILVSFFLESLVIALLGGLVGCALGYLANGITATSIVSAGQGGGKSVIFKLVVDANILAVGLLFTLIMGALGGVLPSVSAMRLRPLESLR